MGLTTGLTFEYFDASDPEDSVEGFEEIETGLRALFVAEIQPFVIAQYSADDEIALNEAFNNWTDMLCKDGEISDHIYNNVTRDDS